jgi:hypothetical protein
MRILCSIFLCLARAQDTSNNLTIIEASSTNPQVHPGIGAVIFPDLASLASKFPIPDIVPPRNLNASTAIA